MPRSHNSTTVIPHRAHSAFNTVVTTLDGGLIDVHVDTQKTDRAIVTLLCNIANRGKRFDQNKILIMFNRKHPNAKMKLSHVKHSLNKIMRDMPGVLSLVNGEYSASVRSLAALDRIEYKRVNGKK